MTTSYLFLLNHYKPLPINHTWLFVDPIIIGVSLFFINYFLANAKKMISFILFIAITLCNFSQLIYSTLYNNFDHFWIIFALSFGIPMCMVIFFAVGLITGSI